MPVLNPKDFWTSSREARKNRVLNAQAGGFEYTDWRNQQPPIWFDQQFTQGQAPGSFSGEQPLRVGDILGAIDIALVCSGSNTEDLVVPAGCTITCTVLGGTEETGPFVEMYKATVITQKRVSLCAGAAVARFPIPQSMAKFVNANIEINGSITGNGTLDLVLAYNPR